MHQKAVVLLLLKYSANITKFLKKMFVFMPTELRQITNMHFDDD